MVHEAGAGRANVPERVGRRCTALPGIRYGLLCVRDVAPPVLEWRGRTTLGSSTVLVWRGGVSSTGPGPVAGCPVRAALERHVVSPLVVAGSGMTGSGTVLVSRAGVSGRARHPPGAPLGSRRPRGSPLVLSAQNFGPLISPRRNSRPAAFGAGDFADFPVVGIFWPMVKTAARLTIF